MSANNCSLVQSTFIFCLVIFNLDRIRLKNAAKHFGKRSCDLGRDDKPKQTKIYDTLKKRNDKSKRDYIWKGYEKLESVNIWGWWEKENTGDFREFMKGGNVYRETKLRNDLEAVIRFMQ